MEESNLRKLLHEDIDDVEHWAGELSGLEPELNSYLEELVRVFTDCNEERIVRSHAIRAVRIIGLTAFPKNASNFELTRDIINALLNILATEVDREFREDAECCILAVLKGFMKQDRLNTDGGAR